MLLTILGDVCETENHMHIDETIGDSHGFPFGATRGLLGLVKELGST